MRRLSMIKWIFAICIAIMVAGCSELDVSSQPVVDDEKETPPTVYVPAGFYVWDGGEVSLNSNFSLMALGIYEEAVTYATYYLEVTYADDSDTCAADTTPIECEIRRYTRYYSTPVTYSQFYGDALTAVVDQMWAYAPTDVTHWSDFVQVFASISAEVTYPVASTVPSQLVLLMSGGYPSQLSYFVDFDNRDYSQFALTQATLVDPPSFGLVDTSPEQSGAPNYAPVSLCDSGSSSGVYLYQEDGELLVEATEGPYVYCGSEYNYFGVDIRIRGKLRPAPKPDNLSMVCTPGVGCAFSP